MEWTEQAWIPPYDQLLWPTLSAVRELGHSARIEEIDERVIETGRFTEEQIAVPHEDGPSTEIEYRLAWARTYLKGMGLLDNPARGTWVTTARGKVAVIRAPRETPPPCGWLHQRHRDRWSGDGGIDGVGVYRLSLVSFPVYFQCKRYKGSVGPEKVRDFRGAMQGRGDKGLLITTGNFTAEAKKEVERGAFLSLCATNAPLGVRVSRAGAARGARGAPRPPIARRRPPRR